MRVGLSRRRIVLIGILVAWSAGGAVAGCSSNEADPDPPNGLDASPDGSRPDGSGPDGAIGDAAVKDQASPPRDGDVDADAGDGSVVGCTPSATQPCVRRVWANAASQSYTCALIDKPSATGVLECWGRVGVPLGLDAGMYDGGCTTIEDGAVACPEIPAPALHIPRTFPFDHAKHVALGAEGVASRGHVCAVEWDAGGVRCWGANRQGELGNNSSTSLPSPPNTSVVEGMDAVQVSGGIGAGFTCSRGEDGSVFCWGRNSGGQLGLGDGGPPGKSPVPLRVSGFSASQLVVSNNQVCAIRSGDSPGTIWCWGQNSLAATDPIENWTAPTRLGVGLTGVVQIAQTTGTPHSTICALLATKRVSCWGDNTRAELAIDPTIGDSRRDTPVDMGLTDVQEIAAGARSFCARTGAGTVKCWGLDTAGQCGVDPITGAVVTEPQSNDKMVVTPTEVAGLTNVVELAMGYEHSCARLANGGLKCWGRAGVIGVKPVGSTLAAVATPVSVVDWE